MRIPFDPSKASNTRNTPSHGRDSWRYTSPRTVLRAALRAAFQKRVPQPLAKRSLAHICICGIPLTFMGVQEGTHLSIYRCVTCNLKYDSTHTPVTGKLFLMGTSEWPWD